MKRYANLLLLQALIFLGISACAGVSISYFDATTYAQLTSLKAETTMLVESFDTKPYTESSDKIEATMLNLRKAYEYEKGKGEKNKDTTDQITKVTKLFLKDVADYKESGPRLLGANYFQEEATLLGQAFDIAIKTENLKNKENR
jgi:hypothetical protein